MKKKFKRYVGLCLAIIMLFANSIVITSAEENVNLSDVLKYYPFSSWAVDTGIKYKLIFLENNTREVKRFEVANIFYNISDIKENKKSIKDFADISDMNDVIKQRISDVTNLKIISGYEDGTFRPMNNVTRAEFVTMLSNSGLLANYKNEVSNVDFYDIAGHWAEKNIKKIAKAGIVSGKGENNFCPEEGITPQEILIILDRLVTAKCITEDKVVAAITDTFQSKKYADEEQYIVEVMYGQFDKMQNDIKHAWPFSYYYNPENWQEPATYNDLLYAMYFTTIQNESSDATFDSGEKMIDRMTKYMFEVQGLENNKEAYKDNKINMRNMIYAIYAAILIETRNVQSWNNIPYEADSPGELKFSNVSKLSAKDWAALTSTCTRYRDNKPYYDNNNMYFPMEAPVTKYMLNYTILRLQERYNYCQNVAGGAIANFYEHQGVAFETDESKLPYNCYEYPYIMEGVPKEVYEKPFKSDYDNQGFYNPRQCNEQYSKFASRTKYNARKYFDLILNVDYRTMNVDSFSKEVASYGYTNSDSVREYAKYVIDNQIILKGKGELVPGTMYLVTPQLWSRAVITFDVISAINKKNLLYGDMFYTYNGNLLDVEYNKEHYDIVCDVRLSGVMNFQKWEISEYRIISSPMIENIYYENSGISIMP